MRCLLVTQFPDWSSKHCRSEKLPGLLDKATGKVDLQLLYELHKDQQKTTFECVARLSRSITAQQQCRIMTILLTDAANNWRCLNTQWVSPNGCSKQLEVSKYTVGISQRR